MCVCVCVCARACACVRACGVCAVFASGNACCVCVCDTVCARALARGRAVCALCVGDLRVIDACRVCACLHDVWGPMCAERRVCCDVDIEYVLCGQCVLKDVCAVMSI